MNVADIKNQHKYAKFQTFAVLPISQNQVNALHVM